MADVKISALPAATTPLAGTEVLPIVQSATTKQVSIANVTAGRAISASSLTLTTPLEVASGGTGLTSLTAGYIPFGAGTSAFGSDSALFWDNTNKRLSIGNTSNSQTGSYTPVLQVQGTGVAGSLGVIRYSTPGAGGALISLGASRASLGSGASTALTSGDGVGSINFYGADGTNFVNNCGSIICSVDGSVSTGIVPTRLSFITMDSSGSGSERMRITSAGNVGIGTTSPSNKFTVYDTTSDTQIELGYAATYGWKFGRKASDGSLRFTGLNGGATLTDLLTLDISGNLGLGVTPSGWVNSFRAFQIGTGGAVYQWSGSNAFVGLSSNYYLDTSATSKYIAAGAAARYEQSAGAHIWGYAASGSAGGTISWSEAARIDSSGNLLVGKTTTAETTVGWNISGNGAGNCKIASGQYFVWNRDEDNIIVNFRRSNTSVGTISVTTTATAYNTSSDISLKENVSNSPSALSSILMLPIRQFDWKADGSHTDYGVVAQEAHEYAPEMITQGDLWQADYGRITPRLIKAFQELAAKVTALEATNG